MGDPPFSGNYLQSSRRISFLCCTQNTHSRDIFVHVQLFTDRIAQVQSLTTRTRVAQRPTRQKDCALWCLQKRFGHPSVMSHLLSHLSLSTSSRSLSPTSPFFRTSSPSLSCPLELDQETLEISRRSGGSTKSYMFGGFAFFPSQIEPLGSHLDVSVCA